MQVERKRGKKKRTEKVAKNDTRMRRVIMRVRGNEGDKDEIGKRDRRIGYCQDVTSNRKFVLIKRAMRWSKGEAFQHFLIRLR